MGRWRAGARIWERRRSEDVTGIKVIFLVIGPIFALQRQLPKVARPSHWSYAGKRQDTNNQLLGHLGTRQRI